MSCHTEGEGGRVIHMRGGGEGEEDRHMDTKTRTTSGSEVMGE